tara:strand:- start:1021 stop:1428 length:408 start_codon:yes stop_codon:yes gene_type:complete
MSAVTAAAVSGLFGLVDDLFTSKEEKMLAKVKLMEIAASGDLGQLEVNKAEAGSRSLFVAGWRPFIGWTCGAAFVWAFLLTPLLETIVFYVFVFAGVEIDLSGVPKLDLSTMLPVLLGMLGLGGLRTFEKSTGAA